MSDPALSRMKKADLVKMVENMTSPEVRELRYKDGKLDMTLAHEMFGLFAEALYEQFKLCGGTNYVHFDVTDKKSGEMFSLSLQRKRGKTPADVNGVLKEALVGIADGRGDPRFLANAALRECGYGATGAGS